MADVNVIVNGRTMSIDVASNRILAEFLRDELQLTGCRVACDSGHCGACTVLLDGELATACSTFVFEVNEKSIETIEGLSLSDGLHPIQQAFLTTDAFQCGFCTSGFIMSVKALLEVHPAPDDDAIRDWLNGNICRCTGYQSIIEATRLASVIALESGV